MNISIFETCYENNFYICIYVFILKIYVVDCSDKRRLEETSSELTELLTDEKLKGVPLLVYANKQDVPSGIEYTY